MKSILKVLIILALAVPLAAFAQEYNHGEVAAFGDFYRPQNTGINLYGVGGRVGFNVAKYVQLEADGAYDFAHNYSGSITGICPGGVNNNNTCSTTTTGLRASHLEFGPKFQFGSSSPVRVFAFVKGGLVRYGLSNAPVTIGNAISNPNITNTTFGTVYPGAGIEFFAGWFGLRGDVGDEIYFNNGHHNNLRITFGPAIRF